MERRWWHSDSTGSEAPLDAILRADGSKITPGVAEMCCRLNIGSTSFDRTAADLLRAAQIELSGETVRTIVIDYGQRVLVAQGSGLLATSFTAADCKVRKSRPARKQEPAAAVRDRTTPAANGSASRSAENLADEARQPSTESDSTEHGTIPTCTSPHSGADDVVLATPSRTEQNANAEASSPQLVEEEITRMYLGVDGVMVPTVTDIEKAKRREGIEKRRAERVKKLHTRLPCRRCLRAARARTVLTKSSN